MKHNYHINYRLSNNSEIPNNYGDISLVQIGRRHCFPGDRVSKHVHGMWYELTLVLDGEGQIITNDIPIKVSKGDIYLSFPCEFHEIVSTDEAPLKYDFFSFYCEEPLIKKEFQRIEQTFCNAKKRVFCDETIRSIISFAISELTQMKKYYDRLLGLILEESLFLIIRNFDGNKDIEKRHSNSADELCFQVMHYIDTHIYDIRNLSDLCVIFNFNYSYLSKLFKNTTGKTISEYYQTRRFDTAKFLIIENSLTITQIAELLNFASLYSFSKAFKSRYEVSPSHYLSSLSAKFASTV